MNILVTDGESRPALAVIRSLGRAGHRVVVTSTSRLSIGASSRYCNKSYRVHSPMADARKYADDLLRIVRVEHVDMVVPVTEQSIYSINSRRRTFGQECIVACADEEKMRAVSDKAALFRVASQLQVPVPKTHFIDSEKAFSRLVRTGGPYPVVVKPSYSKAWVDNRLVPAGVKYARDEAELVHVKRTYAGCRFPFLVQELVRGPGIGFFTIFDGDDHLAMFSHRRLLEKPPSGGVSVLSQSIPPDRQVVEDSAKLLRHVKWDGIAMVELKQDEKDGTHKLMEINGRLWGSVQLPIMCGVNFPDLLVRYYAGHLKNRVEAKFETGRKMIWLLGLLDHLFLRLKEHGRSRSLALNLPGPGATARSFLSEPLKLGFDVVERRDLIPGITEVASYLLSLGSGK